MLSSTEFNYKLLSKETWQQKPIEVYRDYGLEFGLVVGHVIRILY